jgi:hypothetical protein
MRETIAVPTENQKNHTKRLYRRNAVSFKIDVIGTHICHCDMEV